MAAPPPSTTPAQLSPSQSVTEAPPPATPQTRAAPTPQQLASLIDSRVCANERVVAAHTAAEAAHTAAEAAHTAAEARHTAVEAALAADSAATRFRGVRRCVRKCITPRYESQFQEQGKRTGLGAFESDVRAATAYDLMVLKCRSERAFLNFGAAAYEDDRAWLEQTPREQLVLCLRRGEEGAECARRGRPRKEASNGDL